MKRMNEVFELPIINADRLPDLVMNTSWQDDEAICNAINHVDALADALATCTEILGDMPAHRAEVERAYHQAKAALADYRGKP